MPALTRTRQRERHSPEPNSARLIAALERAWAAIRARHPEVPPAVIITGAGSEGRSGLTLGHFAASRWVPAPDATDDLPEIFIGGEGLARGAGPVLATLLHEAAHALAHARAIKDTSRQGRYHNRRFKTLAEELGLEIHDQPGIGWSGTTLPATTAAYYSNVVAELEQAITLHRRTERRDAGDGRASNNPQACLCACPRRIRVAAGVLAAGPIICAICLTPFTPPEDTDE